MTIAEDPACHKCPHFDRRRQRCLKNTTEGTAQRMLRAVAIILGVTLATGYIMLATFGG